MTRIAGILSKVYENPDSYKGKLNSWIQVDGAQVNFRALDGTLEDGLTLDVQVKIGHDVYHYSGRSTFKATLNGKEWDPTSDIDELGMDIEMFISNVVSQDYPAHLGAPQQVIDDLTNLMDWQYKKGDLVKTEWADEQE